MTEIKHGTLVRFKADGPEGRTYRVSGRSESEYGDSVLELEGGRQSHTVRYALESDIEEVKRPAEGKGYE